MNHAATEMSNTLAKITITRLSFPKMPGQGLSAVDNHPRHLQTLHR